MPVEPHVADPALIPSLCAEDLARLLGVGVRRITDLDKAGLLPRPAFLGRQKRWDPEEFVRWRRAGCPNREAWESMKTAPAPAA